MKNILFVCTGNTCRSPLAEGLFRRMVAGRADYTVGSAGVSAMEGEPVSAHTARLLQEIGEDPAAYRSKQLTSSDVQSATHLVAMTRAHLHWIEQQFPEARDKTYLISEFSPDDALRNGDVLDPVGLARQAYLDTRDQLQALLPSLLLYIDQTTKSSPDFSPPMTQALPTEPMSASAAPPLSTSGVIAVGADHGGVVLKTAVVEYLKAAGHQVEDVGTFGTESVDYPDYAEEVCARVLDGRAQDGVLVCTSGIGMCISANRHIGIQAALVADAEDAATTREHNNANVLCLSGKHLTNETVKPVLDAFFKTPFAGGRHARRVAKMNAVGENAALVAADPEIAAAIAAEKKRQQSHIELIASENFVSAAVRAAQGSHLTNKYAEGYPGKRWYGGCEFVDEVEQLAIDRLCQLFNVKFANVQPHSGSQANAAVYFSVLQHGDRILTMDLSHGGHLTHGHPANFSGKFYQVQHYGVEKETGRIDYDELERAAKEFQPKMITAGASAYSRVIDFERMAAIAKGVGAYLFVDMAHIAGLVAAGTHPSPIPHADFITSTTHKSLRGPRGGIIMTNNPELAKKVNAMVFPGIQGGPLMHVIAAKAVCFHEALQPSFKEYQRQVVKNAAALADSLTGLGYTILSGGTDNHVMMVDLRPQGMNGAEASEVLDHAGITVNKNTIPFDTGSPMKPSGIRLGSPAVTTRGMKEKEMALVAGLINRALKGGKDAAALAKIKAEVEVLNRDFPLP